jgi:hypothetical protein
MFQSIGSLPYCSSASLHREKHLQDTPSHTNEIKLHSRAYNQTNPYLEPMKGDDVLYAPSGDGCDVLIIVLWLGSMPLHLQIEIGTLCVVKNIANAVALIWTRLIEAEHLTAHRLVSNTHQQQQQ